MLAACAATIAGAPVAWFMAEPAAAVVASAASEVRDLAEMLGQRSPGARTQALLNKHARVPEEINPKPRPATPATGPHEPAGPSTTALIDLLLPPAAPVTVASNDLPPVIAPPTTLNEVLNPMPGGGTFTPPSNGGTTRLPTSEPGELVTSAVPEPQTWALMLLGFGLIGWRIRRRKSRRALSSPRTDVGAVDDQHIIADRH